MGFARAVGSYAFTQNYLASDVYEILDATYMGLESDLATIMASVSYSTENKKGLLKPIDSEITQAINSIQQLQLYISENIIEAERLTLIWSDVFNDSTHHIDNIYKFVNAAIPLTESLLKARRDDLSETFILISLSALVLLIVTFYFDGGHLFFNH